MRPTSSLTIMPMAVCDIIALGFSICFTGLTTAVGIPWAGYLWDDMHGFVVPYVLSTALATLLSIMALSYKNRRTLLVCCAATVNLALPIFCWYAISRWPGGDDGGGMAWLIFVVPLTVLIMWSSTVPVANVVRTLPLNRYTVLWPWLIPCAALIVTSIGSTAWAAKILFSMFQ
jgi:hypothetical protein